MLLDKLDVKIIEFLQNDSRIAFLQISKQLGVSESTIRKRVARLKSKGAIRAFTVLVDSTLSFESIIAIKCQPKKTNDVAEKIRALSHLLPIAEVTGRFDIFCTIAAPTSRELNEIIDRIRAFDGVVETESFLVVKKV